MLSVKDFKQQDKKKGYKPSKDEVIKTDYVNKRFMEMQQARTEVDKDWEIYQTMIDAIFVPYPDERSSSVVPLASSMIELYVAEAQKIKTEYTSRAETSEFADNAKWLEYVWEYDRRKNKRDQPFTDNEYISAWFWTAVIYAWFESYIKTQHDPIIWDDMSIKWVKNSFKEEKIIVKNVDIRDFYIDNQARTSINEASDCIYKQRISFEKFQNYANSPLYKNIDKVSSVQYSQEYHTFITPEEIVKQWEFVQLTHYWNVEKDMYVVMWNGIIIREHPMISTIDGKKALPFVIRILGKKNYSIYGRWICEALMMFNSEVNNLRELLMDSIRRSNTQVLALWNWLNFDGRSFSYDNEILTFDWNLANNFEQISWNGPNQAIFSYLDRLYKDIAVFIWIDIQNIIWQPQQTAFQTEVQREASQKRINVWLTNRNLAYERFADLYKDLLQTYFPRKTAEWLYPQIEIDWEEFSEGKFKKKKWKHMFEVTPEVLRWQIYIDVHTNTTAPTINAVDRQQKLDLLNTIGQISEWYAMAKQAWVDVESILPLKKTLSDLASDYNLEVQANDEWSDVEEKKAQLMNDIKSMMIKPWQWEVPWEEALPPEPNVEWAM